MKVYISGKISGLELKEAIEKFSEAAQLAESIGLIPINPLDNVDLTKTWEQHMIKDIELLFQCQAIFLLDNWKESRGARIEKAISDELGLIQFHEKTISTDKKVSWIQATVEEITCVQFDNFTKKSRKRNWYFARMLFVYHCIESGEISIDALSELVNRNKTSILRYLNNYRFEVKYNSHFRNLAKRVEFHLTNNVSR
jgi:hypothetical protein